MKKKVLTTKAVDGGWIVVTTCGIEMAGHLFTTEAVAEEFAEKWEPTWSTITARAA